MVGVVGKAVGGAGEGAGAGVEGEVVHAAKAETGAVGAEGGGRVERGAKVERGVGVEVGVTVTARKKAVQRVGLENPEAAAANGVIIKKMERKRRKAPVQYLSSKCLMACQLEE